MEKRRVVITGLGTVNPLGNNVADSWAAARAGKCGIGPITQFDTTDFKCKLAGEVKDFDPATVVDKKEVRKMARFTLLPFAPTSFMHFAFGMSDMDEGHYLRTVLLGKGAMVGMMAVFGQSLLSSLRNPGYLVLAIAIWGGMYWVSKQFCKKHDIN